MDTWNRCGTAVAGLNTFVVYLACELSPLGITANVVSPGMILMDQTARAVGSRSLTAWSAPRRCATPGQCRAMAPGRTPKSMSSSGGSIAERPTEQANRCSARSDAAQGLQVQVVTTPIASITGDCTQPKVGNAIGSMYEVVSG